MVDADDVVGGTRSAAAAYIESGWSVVPVPKGSKNPGFKGWERLRLTREEVEGRFQGEGNIGVLLGEPSGWLVDVDLDHPRAVALAEGHLPKTAAVFGRPGNPRSHWLYYVLGPTASKKHRSKSAGMLVELRSTGMQTVFPPSVHPSGETIAWDGDAGEPAVVEPETLLDGVKSLADAVREELGEKQPAKVRKERPTRDVAPKVVDPQEQAARCLAAMERIGVQDQADGSHRLFVCACRAVEHDLDPTTARETIREYARRRPFPRDWSDEEIDQRLRDAEKQCRRGQALQVDDPGVVPLGERDPNSGRLVLSPKRTLPTAEAYVRVFYLQAAGRGLHCYAGLVLEWNGSRYQEVEENAVRQRLHRWLHAAQRYAVDRRTGEKVLVDFESNPATVQGAMQTLKATVHLPADTPCPSWLEQAAAGPPPGELIACRSSLLHLPTLQRLSASPLYFTTSALEFDPDFEAPAPEAWQRFLQQLFGGDGESHDLLQEWFGYCLTGDTSQQKMLLMVGPKRSGKGTIARVLTRLVGPSNVCGPTTSSLAGSFGLQPLIGKSLAIVSDARFHGENVAVVVERLLCISGEDALTIDRKHQTSVTLRLPTRFVFLTNELPKLGDASGALAGRFVILRLTESFYGQEDHSLTERLYSELPGILNWSIDGWRRLRERGRFVVPASVREVVQEIEDLSSPVSAFVRDACTVGPGQRVSLETLYEAWRWWCEGEGRQAVGPKQTFGRNLSAAVPGLSRRRGTGQQSFYEGIGLKG